MAEIVWERYPLVAKDPHARAWLSIQMHLGLAANTLQAYGYGLEDFLRFCEAAHLSPLAATQEHIALYVHDLANRPRPLANATIQQRLTATRLLYDYFMEEGFRTNNPVGRGRYTPGKAFGGKRERGLVPSFRKLPWIPNEAEWEAVLKNVGSEPLRNRVMFALGYDAGLRREELCLLETSDIDPARRLLRIRAETTKNRQERIVPYSEVTSLLYRAYLLHRRDLSQERGPLFLSESRRNWAQPLSVWTWSKVIKGVAEHAGVSNFTTHTLRHLCLTDLARAGWDIHEIAIFAGHRSVQSTLRYIHLSGRELAAKFEKSMTSLHQRRIRMLAEWLS